MFVWRKRASTAWLAANEMALRKIASHRLAIISEPPLRNTIVEIASSDSTEVKKIRSLFGGVIERLPRNWLKKSLRNQKCKPLKIGRRLLIVSSGRSGRGSLVIPANTAFGTGAHVTTAMSLRLLEKLTRFWEANAGRLRFPEKRFSLVDLGTGSGILALAAARLGAKRIIAIDNDPMAILTAKENARRNKIENVDFRVADVRRWKFPTRIDVVTANLFSELLIEILAKLKCADWSILSGVLHRQEPRFLRAMEMNRLAIVERRRRGKWVAFVVRHPER